MHRLRTALAVLTVAVLAGCGDSTDTGDAPAPRAATSEKLRTELRGATASTAADFPATKGRTLQQVADSLGAAGPQLGLATSVFTEGENRLAFGVIDPKTGFVYGKTAIYVADAPDDKASGPYPAPADLLVTDTAYRSQTAASEEDPFAAIYAAQVPLKGTGEKSILSVTRVGKTLVGAPGSIRVGTPAAKRIPEVGDKAPAFSTDTVAEAGGNVASIDTRIPPSDMHEEDAKDLLGSEPFLVLFATPKLCASRVCGPVVDIAAQLKATYGTRMTFIHQEVYEDNDASKPLREPLRRFNLPTEPWLFVFDQDGRIAARLEGSFGFDAFEQAIKAGLAGAPADVSGD